MRGEITQKRDRTIHSDRGLINRIEILTAAICERFVSILEGFRANRSSAKRWTSDTANDVRVSTLAHALHYVRAGRAREKPKVAAEVFSCTAMENQSCPKEEV